MQRRKRPAGPKELREQQTCGSCHKIDARTWWARIACSTPAVATDASPATYPHVSLRRHVTAQRACVRPREHSASDQSALDRSALGCSSLGTCHVHKSLCVARTVQAGGSSRARDETRRRKQGAHEQGDMTHFDTATDTSRHCNRATQSRCVCAFLRLRVRAGVCAVGQPEQTPAHLSSADLHPPILSGS